jgi:hypothetical protein
MANVPTQLSPGVNITEIDLSGIVREAGNNVSGFVGQFRWGPASENIVIDTETRFTDIFLPPTNNLPEKMQDDFFNVTNYFRYSDKLKIVRVVHETARNARAGQSSPAAPILIHNDEVFFAKADPTGVGAKNYSSVLANANWIARYPGDVGNSIEVRAIGAGTFVQGSQNQEENNGENGGPEEPANTFHLPLLRNGSLLNGVTYSIVTVPQITEINSNDQLAQGGTTWASYFIGDGTTLPTGNTWGVKYLCFYLRGSSYCTNTGTFPIPGGSYGYIAGSNTAGGLTYSAYYRDRWLYGTFGNVNQNETDNEFWTNDGPLLAARLQIGLTMASGGITWNRFHNFGKGFHQTTGSHSSAEGTVGIGSLQSVASGSQNGENYSTIQHQGGINNLIDAAIAYSGADGWLTNLFKNEIAQRVSCLEIPKTGSTTYLMKPRTLPSNLHMPRTYNVNSLTFPTFVVLPFDNSAGAITEPMSETFKTSTFTYAGTTSFGGIANAGVSVTRTASDYSNYGTGRVVYKWSGTGITTDNADNAKFPLRPVINSFPGITAAGNKGMILMFAYAQPITGMTSGLLSTWHAGITTNSQVYIDNNLGSSLRIETPINNVDGLLPNAALPSTATNLISSLNQQAQILHGLSGEFDATFLNTDVSTFVGENAITFLGLIDTPVPVFTAAIKSQGGQAIPFKQSDIGSTIKDFVIYKKPSQ